MITVLKKTYIIFFEHWHVQSTKLEYLATRGYDDKMINKIRL
jgi:hypothetical protein